MNTPSKQKSAGVSFYAALSLSIAMVGAACWYAYSVTSRNGVKPAPSAESSTADTLPNTSLPAVTTTAATTPRTTPSSTTTRPVQDVAAIISRTTPQTAASTTSTAETTPKIEPPIRPLAGDILLPFSNGELIKSQTTGIWQTHNGTDYAAEIGAEVAAVLDGTVSEIKRDALYGVCVSVTHADGTVTRYCGLSEGVNVMAGQLLERGTVIGAVGDTNDAESAMQSHLHFEVLKNSRYLDPEMFLNGQ